MDVPGRNDQRSTPSVRPIAWRMPSSLAARTRSPATAILVLTGPPAWNIHLTTGDPIVPDLTVPACVAAPLNDGQSAAMGCGRVRRVAATPAATSAAIARRT